MTGWEHFAHGADVGVRGRGPTLTVAFEQAALALTAVTTDPARVEPRLEVSVECEAPDRELLLVDWLNALVYHASARRLVLGRFQVHLDDDGRALRGTAWGEPVDRERHQPELEVKGATYTALRVAREGEEWVAECVVDV